MRRHKKIRLRLYDYARSELSDGERTEIAYHLTQCGRCRTELEILNTTLRALTPLQESPAGRQPGEYWTAFASRVERRMADRTRQPSRFRMVSDSIVPLLRPRWKPAVAFAGGFVLILLIAGVWMNRPVEKVPDFSGGNDIPIVQAAQRAEVRDYFERSRTLLIGVANIPAADGDKIDLSVERTAARGLVRQARYLGDKPLDSRSQELIRELERVLIELANMEEQADVPEVEMIRTEMHQQNLLFKIRMAENRIR
jgi:hypothetical protein